MDPITVMMLIGAATGAIGGGSANAKRIKKNNQDFDILNGKLAANDRAKIRYADRFKGQIENAGLEASEGAKRESAAAFQETAKGEAAAGQSGTVGGTPFYLLGKFAADTQESLRTASVMRANSLAAMRAEGVDGLEQYDDRADEIERMVEGVAEEANYLSSGLGWALSVGTGAAAGAQTAASIGTSLEKTGILAKSDLAAEAAAKPAGLALTDAVPKTFEDSFALSPNLNPAIDFGFDSPLVPKKKLGLLDSVSEFLGGGPRNQGWTPKQGGGVQSGYGWAGPPAVKADSPFKGLFDFADSFEY